MSRFGWVAVAIAVLFTVGGLTTLLLPFDQTVAVPGIADQAPADVVVHCKAPLVDAFTDESTDEWITYRPERGMSYDTSGSAGGPTCSSGTSTRGVLGVSLLLLATMAAAVAAFFGRRRAADGPSPSPAAPS